MEVATPPASAFPTAVREQLVIWFQQYGANTLFEIECRIQDVGAAGFERVLASLQSNRKWTKAPPPHMTLDLMHATGVRETQDKTPGTSVPAAYLRKTSGGEMKTSTPSGYNVKFQVSSEQEQSADMSPVVLYRHKQRFTFEHRNLFKFELTRVKQASTLAAAHGAETSHEIEIEFCGHLQPEAATAEYLADSLLMKVADLLLQLTHAPLGGAGDAKRQRTASGPLQEGEEITLAEGTEVQLQPMGHGVPPRFHGEMPAELVPRWLFSHVEPGGMVHVMSEPARIGNEHFPLFYFCGSVPQAAVGRRFL